MATVGADIYNRRTGQRMIFRTATAELLELEIWTPPHAPVEMEHIHPSQESGARVLSGSLRFRVRGVEHDLGPGESIAIPAGTPHSFRNPGAEDAQSIQFFKPPLNTAAFFETYFALARDGKLDERGMPNPLQLAVMVPAFGEEIRPTRPNWALLKATAALIGPLAKLRGYRATYPYRGGLTLDSGLVSR